MRYSAFTIQKPHKIKKLTKNKGFHVVPKQLDRKALYKKLLFGRTKECNHEAMEASS